MTWHCGFNKQQYIKEAKQQYIKEKIQKSCKSFSQTELPHKTVVRIIMEDFRGRVGWMDRQIYRQTDN